MTKLFTAVSLFALMAVPAVAQDANTRMQAPAAQTAPAAASTADISASELLNESVKNAANETIGDINDILVANDGKVTAVIVGVGGFLGMGEKDVALPFEQLMFAKDANDDLIVSSSATKESLQTAPEYKKPKDRT